MNRLFSDANFDQTLDSYDSMYKAVVDNDFYITCNVAFVIVCRKERTPNLNPQPLSNTRCFWKERKSQLVIKRKKPKRKSFHYWKFLCRI
ncbi:unnamed protein product [Prunus brigantina]